MVNSKIEDIFPSKTGHILPAENSLILQEVIKLQRYAEENEMLINSKKTKLMLFSESTTVDIQPEIFVNGTETEMVDETKLLGVVLTNDLKWKKNTDYNRDLLAEL